MFAPDTAALTAQLSADYAANAYLMAWGHTLMNTSLYPIDPKPPWFARVDEGLSAAKQTTRKWFLEDYPSIAAGLPQSLIDYGNGLRPAVDELAPILDRPTLTADDRETVADLIDVLLKEANAQKWRVLRLQRTAHDYSAAVADLAARASKDSRDVMASLATSREQVYALQSRIADLQVKLGATTADAKNAMKGAAVTGASVTMTMMAFTITAGIGAASFPVFGLAAAFIGISINAALEASKSEEVRQTIREIGDLRVKLGAELSQTASLQSIATALESLGDVASTSLASTGGTLHHWNDICTNLGLARELIGQPGLDHTRITPFVRLREAAAGWKEVTERAQSVQDSVLTVAPAPIILKGDSA